MKVEVNLDSSSVIIKRRGLDRRGRIQALFTSECARYMDPYVPMQSGVLKNRRMLGPDYVLYNSPYAHYQHEGLLMVAPNGSAWAKLGEPKHYTHPPRSLTYAGAPKRGAYWEVRMWADKRRVLLRLIERAIHT